MIARTGAGRLSRGLWSVGAVALLVVLGAVVFAPGLKGWFLLDDIPVLGELERIRYLPLRERMLFFVFGGETGPLGRPLAMASFLINDYAWPTDSASFKYTNLCIHLIVGLLVYWILLLLTDRLPSLSRRDRHFAAFAVAAIWLIHPLQTSSVLYVVQRMTLLSALFVTAGLVLYLKGRLDIERHALRGYLLMSAGVVFGTGLGIFSKENAVLLPVYALACEYTLVRAGAMPVPGYYRVWKAIFLWLPVIGLVLWHVLRLEGIAASYGARPFTMVERLYTEPRVLFMYLSHILVPRRQGTGVFQDDIDISKSLVDPITTVIALAAWLVLLSMALRQRKRWPVFGFAVFWFLGGHALEAGPISLELYFEHRNYLPMLGPLLALVYAALSVPSRLKRFTLAATLVFVALTAYASYQNAALWRNIPLLTWNWAEEHPRSPRAQMFLANQWALVKRYDEVETILLNLTKTLPRNTGAPVTLVHIRCLSGKDFEELDWDTILSTISSGDQDTSASETLGLLVKKQATGGCPGLADQRLTTMLHNALGNPSFQSHRRIHGSLNYTMGEYFLYRRDPHNAIEWMNRAFGIDPSAELALKRAQIYADLRRYDAARAAVEEASRLDSHSIWGFPLHAAHIEQWRRHINDLTADHKHQ
jgi:tetratricopeptide (TPR) repeat protein